MSDYLEREDLLKLFDILATPTYEIFPGNLIIPPNLHSTAMRLLHDVCVDHIFKRNCGTCRQRHRMLNSFRRSKGAHFALKVAKEMRGIRDGTY